MNRKLYIVFHGTDVQLFKTLKDAESYAIFWTEDEKPRPSPVYAVNLERVRKIHTRTRTITIDNIKPRV